MAAAMEFPVLSAKGASTSLGAETALLLVSVESEVDPAHAEARMPDNSASAAAYGNVFTLIELPPRNGLCA
jgi:hypothetical protein